MVTNGPTNRLVRVVDQLGVHKRETTCEKKTRKANAYVSVVCMRSGQGLGLFVPPGGETATSNADMVQQYWVQRSRITGHDNNCNVARLLRLLEALLTANWKQIVDILHYAAAADKKKKKMGHRCSPANCMKDREEHLRVRINSSTIEQLHAAVSPFDSNHKGMSLDRSFREHLLWQRRYNLLKKEAYDKQKRLASELKKRGLTKRGLPGLML